jgi:hypothetical protein
MNTAIYVKIQLSIWQIQNVFKVAVHRLHSRSTEILLYRETPAESNKTANLTTRLPNVSSKTLNGNLVAVNYYPALLKRLSGRPGYTTINISK